MPELRIHYAGSVVRGPLSRETWDAGPDGVQVVVVAEPYPDGLRPWAGVDDRQLWTGDDPFDPASPTARLSVPSLPGDWPPKRGLLIPDAEYFRIWEEAAHGR